MYNESTEKYGLSLDGLKTADVRKQATANFHLASKLVLALVQQDKWLAHGSSGRYQLPLLPLIKLGAS